MSSTTFAPPANASTGELIRWAFEMLNRHDVEALRPCWNSETVERFPDRTCRGPEEIAQYFVDVFAAMPDFHMEVLTLVAQGDDVFVHWRLTGTHRGSIQGIAPTGRRLSIDGIDHFVFRNGKVVSNFVVFDQMQYARQLGLLPPDGSPADRRVKRVFNARTKLTARLRPR